MRNNKGFGKFEILTTFLLMMSIMAYLFYSTLGGTSKQKIATMKNSAQSLLSTATVNADSFKGFDVVYLDEVIQEGFLSSIKSPFSAGDCSISESKVYLGGTPSVTLKCDSYLIEKADFTSKDVEIYKVGKWSNKKIEDAEEQKLYNCIVDGKDKYEQYNEDFYFMYKINEDYGTNYYSMDEVKECKVIEKTFYRTKEIQK